MTSPTTALFVDLTAQAVGLPIPDLYRDGVLENFERIQAVAQQLLEFPLPDPVEAAPVFQP